MVELRRQSSLGTEFRRLYREDTNINKILLAKVTNVNYRYNTVDVQAIETGMAINKSGQEGRYSAKLPVQFGGRTQDGKPFGQITPIEVGSLVLIGFINSQKTKPIVISVYNDSDETHDLARAPFSRVDERDEDLKQQANHQFTVYPSLTYEDIDGNGNRTVSFTGKSFITIDGDSIEDMSGVTDDGDGYGYEDLDSSYYYSGELIEPKSGMAPTILFKHVGDRYNESGEVIEDKHALMMFIKPDGTYRTSIVNKDEDWKTYLELDAEGEYTIRRQQDNKGVGKGDQYHEFKVGKEGISMRSGDKYFLFNQDGIDGNVGFGGGGSAGELDALLKRIDDIDGNILSMKTNIEQTDEYIRLSAEQVIELDGKLRDLDASIEIRADQIEQRVTELVTDMVDTGLKEFSDDLAELQQDAVESMKTLQELSDDGMLTALEKKTIMREWDMIKAEYVGYKAQADIMEVSTADYVTRYTALENYITPILADMDKTTEIDRILFNNRFQNYYVARGNMLYTIFEQLKKESDDATKKAIQASLDSANAVVEATLAYIDAEKANQLLQDIAEDGKITPQEKRPLEREYNSILAEWEGYVEQAMTYELSTLAFEDAKDAVINLIESTGVFNNMMETTEVNGALLRQVFATYFTERSNLLATITGTTKGILDDFSKDLEYYNTAITSTSKEISLVAESVKMLGKEVEVNRAELSIQADRISSRVSRVEMERNINTTLDKLNSGGKNMYVYTTATDGKVSPTTGEVSAPTSGDKVSNYIGVEPNVDYIATVFKNIGLTTITIAWYNSSKVFISGVDVSDTEEQFSLRATAPTGAYFARVSHSRSGDVKFQFERGTVLTPYKVSVEDMVEDITVATQERDSRQEMVNYYEQRLNTYKSTGIQDLARVEAMVENYSLSVLEKEELKELFDAIMTAQPTVLAEASIYGVSTVALQGAVASLEDYLEPLFADMGSDSAVIQTTLVNLYKGFYDQRNRVYTNIVNSAKEALQASEDILDSATESAMKAQELANKLAQEADSASRNVAETRKNIELSNQYEARSMTTIERVIQDSILSPTEKVQIMAIVEDFNEELPGLLVQAGTYSLSTSDLQNAINMLSQYFSAFVTTEKRLEDSPISPQTFKTYFENYFNAKAVLLQNVLDGAKGKYDKAQDDSNLAYQEFLRRQEQMIIFQNAVKDSQADIDRLNENIEELKNAVPYRYELTSSKGTLFFDSNINTEISVKLFRGNEDITDKIKPENIVWIKENSDGTLDEAWNRAHIGVGKTIQVTHEDVDGDALFSVELYEELGE